MEKYDAVVKNFGKLFNSEDLLSKIADKIDRREFEKHLEKKASSDLVESADQKIEALHTRLKHLSVFMSELAASNLPQKASSSLNAKESMNTVHKRRDELAK